MQIFSFINYILVAFLLLVGCSSSGTGTEGGGGGEEEPEQYSLTVSSDPSEGGSVDPANGSYEEGTQVSVEATPSEGWEFIEWSGDRSSTNNPFSFTITSDTDLTANFEEATASYSFTASVSPSKAGTVSPQDTTVEEGSQLSVEAVAENGWQFTGWSGDISSSDNPLSLTIMGDTEVSANFEKKSYSLSTTVAPSDAGSIVPSNGTFDHGTEVTIEATPNEGWKFDNWSGDVSSTDNPLPLTITEDTDITANFQQVKSEYSFSLKVEDSEDSMELTFGQTEGATNGFDSGIDKEAPPPPPEGALNAFFEGQDRKLLDDFRAATANNLTWTLNYQLGSGDKVNLSWSLNETTLNGSITLSDDTGSLQVNMLNETEFSFNPSDHEQLLIVYEVEN